MPKALASKIADWIRSDPDGTLGLQALKNKIDYLTVVLFHEYEITKVGTHGDFGFRLARWLDCAPDENQKKIMYLMLEYLFFVGKEEFDSMYKTAYSRHVAQWILYGERINLSKSGAWSKMQRCLENTLFTAVTESFKIDSFVRVNNIHGQRERYIWMQHEYDWEPSNFQTNILGLKNRIVMLEDFVGSGDQMEKFIVRACELPSVPKVLLCPLIVCPAGAEVARKLTERYKNLTFNPVLELAIEDFVCPESVDGEPDFFKDIRKLVIDLDLLVKGSEPTSQYYGPFGCGDTGGLIVKFDNCPDNTLPIFHYKSDSRWSPLFLRISRLEL